MPIKRSITLSVPGEVGIMVSAAIMTYPLCIKIDQSGGISMRIVRSVGSNANAVQRLCRMRRRRLSRIFVPRLNANIRDGNHGPFSTAHSLRLMGLTHDLEFSEPSVEFAKPLFVEPAVVLRGTDQRNLFFGFGCDRKGKRNTRSNFRVIRVQSEKARELSPDCRANLVEDLGGGDLKEALDKLACETNMPGFVLVVNKVEILCHRIDISIARIMHCAELGQPLDKKRVKDPHDSMLVGQTIEQARVSLRRREQFETRNFHVTPECKRMNNLLLGEDH